MVNSASSGCRRAGRGGAVFNSGEMEITSSTIVENSTGSLGSGGGIAFVGDAESALSLKHTVISDNESTSRAPDIYLGPISPRITGVASNYIGNPIGSGVFEGSTAILTTEHHGEVSLSPLGFYGGPTRTMPPMQGSPLVGRAAGSTPLEQRGYPRNNRPDLGATERVEPVDVWDSDWDGDGLTFGIEHAIGRDPVTPDRGGAPLRATFGKGGATLVFVVKVVVDHGGGGACAKR